MFTSMVPLQYRPTERAPAANQPAKNAPRIIDIRREKLEISLEEDILKGLGNDEGEKILPTMLLYSADGLRLFEEITYMDEYYLTNTEIELLERCADSMASRIEDGSVVLELGSGNLRKVNILLNALCRQGKKIDYYALDLDLSELRRTLDMLPAEPLGDVRYNGLHGTYEDGHAWLNSSPEVGDRPRCVLWLGSSLGNFKTLDAVQFLKSFIMDGLRAGSRDCMLVAIDGCKDAGRVYSAYNDQQGITESFIMSGLTNANKILEGEYFDLDKWGYRGEWNAELGRHQAYYVPTQDIRFPGKLDGVLVKKGELVNIEYSYKFDVSDSRHLWEEAGLVESAQWVNKNGDYYFHMLQKPSFSHPMKPEVYAPEPVPRIEEWRELWAVWDTVTLGMVPRERLLTKPIELRNPCVFYLGHIPTFLDSILSRATNGQPTEPLDYISIFQRGIDPDVDNPDNCHSHSEIPTAWPELEDILVYQGKVRERVNHLYKNGSAMHHKGGVQRALWIGFEHEAMHLETLLYMLLQSDITLPPPGTITPNFATGRLCERMKDPRSDDDAWIKVPGMMFDVGMNDTEGALDTIPRYFGWDKEKPVQKDIRVEPFYTRCYPITNEEYAKYLVDKRSNKVPASWTIANVAKVEASDSRDPMDTVSRLIDTVQVKTVFGPVPLKQAMDWPVMASYDELTACAKWMGGRVPTADELLAIYRYAESTDASAVEKKISRKIDAVNGHLVHNGVSESPPSQSFQQARESLFTTLVGRNVGFNYWHPTSVRSSGGKLLGRCETGGAWEWTSTVLKPHEGFTPMKLYPEYTADFFDEKHNIVLGGSWATHPRIAGRKSFINWYQRNYRYMWATARVVRDH